MFSTMERNVTKWLAIAAFVSTLIVAGAAAAQGIQGMLLDEAADKVIRKYQDATCEQLKVQETKAPSEKEKMAIDYLHHDSQARVAFIDKIAAPVLNKMFECGLIP
jgi:demethoxyubiquinone hydroxylase (CLK1/Coq7/Cat5 family)